MQARIAETFTKEFITLNNFTKELYKLVRGKGKKLEDIAKVEERVAENKVTTEEQREKLVYKEAFTQDVLRILEVAELYKKHDIMT